MGLHGISRRIVIVTWFPGEKQAWHSDPKVLKPRSWMAKYRNVFLSGHRNEFGQPLGSSLTYKDRLVSADGCCRVYLGGTQEAFGQYGEKILDFLIND